jgi:hypothetical protein
MPPRSPAYALLILLAVLSAAELAGQSSIEAKIRAAAARLVINQPDFTCLQTIDRFEKRGQQRKFQHLDKIRLEVALINGQEMFSRPGAQQFDIENIAEIVPVGAANTGGFALHAKSVLTLGLAEWQAQGTEKKNGVECLRYAFLIPKHKSQYRLQTFEGSAVVEQHGFFWVNAATYDLVRIEISVDDLPRQLHVTAINESIDYARSQIGAGESVLPVQSISTIQTDMNVTMRNTTTFTQCRQYVGESTVSFGPVDESLLTAPQPPPQAAKELEIPAGLMVELVLDTPLTVGKSVAGDQLIAHLRRNIKKRGEIILPKGAQVIGRINAMSTIPNRSEFHAISILFETVEFDGKRAEFSATFLGFRSPFPPRVIVSTSPTIFDTDNHNLMTLGNQPPSPGGNFYARAPSRIFQVPKKAVLLYQTR